MSPASIAEIRCLNCGAWFPTPFSFESEEAFYTSSLVGNEVDCPACGKATGCNKDNIRVRSPGSGGYLGNDVNV